MDIRQCRNCRKLYQFRGSALCPACVQELDKLFESVRNYIYDNPRATIETICGETGVEDKVLYGWLREGRLILNKDSAKLLQCESCGEPISLGHYCDSCSTAVRSQLEGAARSLDKTPSVPVRERHTDRDAPRMHVDIRKK